MQEYIKKSEVLELLTLPPDMLAEYICELKGIWIDDEPTYENYTTYDDGIKLKPCPFCGGKAEFDTFHDVLTDGYNACVRCTQCNAQTMEVECGVVFGEEISKSYNIRTGLAARWNYRKE